MVLFILTSCGDDFIGGNRAKPQTQAEEVYGILPQSFSTRLNANLMITGEKCRETETTGTFGNGDICNAGQYLVVIDNVNTCSSNNCTNNQVSPRIEGFAVYEIEAKSITTSEQQKFLGTLIVRSDYLGNGKVGFSNN